MERKLFRNDLLNGARLLSGLSGGSYTKTYLTTDGKILKVFPKAKEQNKDFIRNIETLMSMYKNKEGMPPILLRTTNFTDYILASKDLMEKKILYSKDFKEIKGLWLPKDIYYDESGEFMAFDQEQIDGVSLIEEMDYMDEEDICDKLIEVTDIVKEANQAGIHITDLSNLNNIMITSNNQTVICDYNDMQIKELLSDKISTSLLPKCNPIFKTEKYYDQSTGLYNENLDKAALLNNFYALITTEALFGNDFSRRYQESIVNKRMNAFTPTFESVYLGNMLDMASAKNTDIEAITRLCFELKQENVYPDEAIKEYKKIL